MLNGILSRLNLEGRHARVGTDVVDGLRGLAIAVVFAYHTWLFSWYTPPSTIGPFPVGLDVWARTGYLGVDLFFLISGFCLFYTYARHAIEGGKAQSVPTFFYRRFIKIVPSYALALVVTTLVALPTLATPSEAWPAFVQHLFFANNFYNDVFGHTNSVLWSLGIEVQFYAIFPPLAALFVRRPVLAALGMIGIALAFRYSLTCCLAWEIYIRQVPAYLDLFGLGMLTAYGYVHARNHWPWVERARPWFTLAAIVLALVAFRLLASANAVQYVADGRERWNLAGRTELGLVTAAFIFCAALGVRWWHALVANPVLVFLSVISYNLYLWHTTIELWLQHHHLPPTAAADAAHADDLWKAWFIGVSVLACLAVSTAITYFLERPLLDTVRPHRFAFKWGALLRRFRAPGVASPETRT